MMSWLAAWIPGGAEGVPIPYSPRMDDGITIVLLCCFSVGLCAFRSRRFLLQLVKDFLLHRERTSIFATSTAGDMRYLLLLILQTCILSGSAFLITAMIFSLNWCIMFRLLRYWGFISG